MPEGTAFHSRTFPLCESLSYREWAGYYAVSSYETHHEHEYAAIRNGAALIDVTPLYKYLVTGRDATRLVDRIVTRDATKVAVGQVIYTPWCDERGKVVDDGTVTRVEEQVWRWTAAEPSLRWFRTNAAGLDVTVDDISQRVAALAVQGPTSARLLSAAGEIDLATLKYFRMTRGHIGGVSVDVTRTGYTGDLGYEIWVPWERAVDVWDRLLAAGGGVDARPAGMLALDVARIEAGLLLIDVDFQGARTCQADHQRYTPFEMGLGRLVAADKAPFIGRAALAAERRRGARRQVVGLEIEWNDVERLYAARGLTPSVPATASRVPAPVYRRGRQVGKATSTTWSPVLKRLIALATVEAGCNASGTALEVEVTVEAVRERAGARVVATPFYNPPQKTAPIRLE